MFTLEQVLEAARAVVEEKGSDYVYPESEKASISPGNPMPACRYSHKGQPSCLVGHVIYRLDPAAFQSVMESEEAEGAAAASELIEYGYLPPDFWDDEAEEAMRAAQACQDKEGTWGTALNEAEQAVL